MKRALGVVVVLQLGLVLVWLAVERGRVAEARFVWERSDEPAPVTVGTVDLAHGVVVVHFWATWCAPCVEELPQLLEAADRDGVRLVAATDEPWPVVERFFGGDVPAAVVRDVDGAARRAFSVSGLPDTFVVEDGRVVARVGGPRDWTSSGARRFLRGER